MSIEPLNASGALDRERSEHSGVDVVGHVAAQQPGACIVGQLSTVTVLPGSSSTTSVMREEPSGSIPAFPIN
jgi:hypothetical protein